MTEETPKNTPASGSHILRHELLPLLLGEEEESILYWAGKALVRRLEVRSSDELEKLFEEAGLGKLTLKKEKRSGRLYEIESPSTDASRPFTLEAGIIAQTTEQEKGILTEASCTVFKKSPLLLHIGVEWDKKDTTGGS